MNAICIMAFFFVHFFLTLVSFWFSMIYMAWVVGGYAVC